MNIAGVHRAPGLPVQREPHHQPPPVQPPLREGLRDHPVQGQQRGRAAGGGLSGPARPQADAGEAGAVPGDGARAGVRGGGVRHHLRHPGQGLRAGAVQGLPADPADGQLLQLLAQVETVPASA